MNIYISEFVETNLTCLELVGIISTISLSMNGHRCQYGIHLRECNSRKQIEKHHNITNNDDVILH